MTTALVTAGLMLLAFIVGMIVGHNVTASRHRRALRRAPSDITEQLT